MHESVLGGSILDHLTGEIRPVTSFEDLRQSLYVFISETLNYPRNLLIPHYSYMAEVAGESFSREVDLLIAEKESVFLKEDSSEASTVPSFKNKLLLVNFVPGQPSSFKRELTALARLLGFPLAAATDMQSLLLFSTASGEDLVHRLEDFPPLEKLKEMAEEYPLKKLSDRDREMETRLLNAYTGLLKNCCADSCPPEEAG